VHVRNPWVGERNQQGTPHNLHNFSSSGESLFKSPPMKAAESWGPWLRIRADLRRPDSRLEIPSPGDDGPETQRECP
jgi:hypothetical protein